MSGTEVPPVVNSAGGRGGRAARGAGRHRGQRSEIAFLSGALATVDEREAAYTTRFLSSGRAKTARGHRSREQGGKLRPNE